MASLRKSPNSEKKFWIMIYRSADGRQHQVSSRLPATPAFRNQAMHMALELETAAKKEPAAELEHFSRQLNAHELSRKVLGIVEQSAPPPQLTKFKEMAERWLEGKRNRNSRSTFVRYQQVIQEFVRSIGTASLQLPVSYIQPHLS